MQTLQAQAESFLQLVVSGKIREAYDLHVSSNFIHHNPYYPGDRESLMKGMEENEGQFPKKTLQIVHSVEEGKFVAVHSYLQLKAGTMEMAVVHIFRFEKDKIVEMWDIGQQIPDQVINKNGMF